jgi:uncharacterized protein YjbI with pentapeptide repeats
MRAFYSGETDLSRAHLMGADLGAVNLERAQLKYVNLSEANLQGANLEYADLSYADLREADLSGAYLSRADLSYARGITNEQLADARNLQGATMPNGQQYEDWLKVRENRKDG